MTSLSIRGGRAHFRSRYVRTTERAAEQAAGKLLFQCTFGTRPKEGSTLMANLKLKNVVGDAESSLGDAKSFVGDAKSSLGDAESSLGDVKSTLGDAKSSLGGF